MADSATEGLDSSASAAIDARVRTPSEFSRLEGLLFERARQVQAQRLEIDRLKTLLRDAMLNFDRVASTAAPDADELARQRDLAIARAVEAEASRAETVFRLDELLGHMAERGAPSGEWPEALMLQDTCAGLAQTVARLEAELADSRAAAERAEALRAHAAEELSADGSRAEGLAAALRDTRRLLAELSRALESAMGSARRATAG